MDKAKTFESNGASIFYRVIGRGYPLVLMHGGPGSDHMPLLSLKELSDSFTLVFYDHRCNGRSVGADISSMNWENLTADAENLRVKLGFERWALLGQSFGGMVALEYALRYQDRLSHMILLDSGASSFWFRKNVPVLLKKCGFNDKTAMPQEDYSQAKSGQMRHFGQGCDYFLPINTDITGSKNFLRNELKGILRP